MPTSLGDLILELGIDSSRFDRQMREAESRATSFGAKLEGKINNLKVNVDDRALTGLNRHLDLKVKHHKQVQDVFTLNPLTVKVDDRALTNLNVQLDETVKKQKSIEGNRALTISPNGSVTTRSAGYGGASSEMSGVISELKLIRNGLTKINSSQIKQRSTANMFKTGLFEGLGSNFGQSISRQIGRSAKKNLGIDPAGFVGKAADSILDPKKYEGLEDRIVEKLEHLFVYTPKGKRLEKGMQYAREFVEPIREQAAGAVGAGVKIATYPARIRRKVNLARSAELSKQIAEMIDVPDIEGIKNKNRIALISGGVDLDGKGQNAFFARNVMKGVLGEKTASIPLPSVYSNEPDKLGSLFDLRKSISSKMGKDGKEDDRLARVDKMLHLALESGLNPDSVMMQSTKLAYEKKYPGKSFLFGGSSGGTMVADEATAIAERSGDTNVKGFGLTMGLDGIGNLASSKNFKAFTGGIDPLFMAQFGTHHNDESKFSRGEKRIFEETVAGLPLPGHLIKGVFNPTANTEVIPNAGAAHHLGQFVANPEVQKRMQSFLGLPEIDEQFTGKSGTKASKVYADMFGQGNRYESLDRTLKALLGDQGALSEAAAGKYTFTNPDNTLRKSSGMAQKKSDLEYSADEFVVNKQVTGAVAADAQRLKDMMASLIALLSEVGKTSQNVDLEKVRGISAEFDKVYGVSLNPQKEQREMLSRLAQGDESDLSIDKQTIPTLPELRKQEIRAAVKMRMPLDLAPIAKGGEKVEIEAANQSGLLVPRKGMAGVAQKAGDFSEGVLVERINKLLTQVPGQRGVIDANPRQIGSLSELNVKDYVHMARIGGSDVANILGKVAGVAQGVEGSVLDAVPFGRQIKGVGQNIALPAAAFSAAGSLPGGHLFTEAITSAVNGAVGLPAGALAEAISGTVGGALLDAVGTIPMLGPKIAPALANAISSLIESGVVAGAGAVSAAAAPVVGGQLLIGGGKQAVKAIAPGQDQRLADASAIAASTKEKIQMIQSATQRAQRLLPMDVKQSRGLAAMASDRIPEINSQVNQAMQKLTPAERLGSREGNQIANLKSQIASQEKKLSKLEQFIAGLARVATDPAGEINRSVRGSDIIDAEIVEEFKLPERKQKALAPQRTSVKDYQSQIRALGKEFKDQSDAISYTAKNDDDPNKSIQAARELVEAAGIAKEKIEALVKGLGDKSTPELRKAAGIAKGQITRAKTKAGNYTADGVDIGVNVAAGLSSGIRGKIADAERSIRQMAEGVTSAAEDEFEIKSPSRVFQRIGKFVVQGFEQGLEGLDAVGNIFDDFIKNLKKEMPSFSVEIDIAASLLKNFAGGFITFKAVSFLAPMLSGIARESIGVAVEMESIGSQLKFVTGSAQEADAAMNQLFSRSAASGTNVREDIRGFTQLSAASKDTQLEGYTTKQLFEAGQQAGQVFQLDPENQSRVYTSFEQILSKGKVSSEELRQQLGEYLPGAFQIAARSIGVTTAELDKMLERGEVLSSDFLPKFAQQIKAETFSGLAGAANTTQAAMNRLDTQMVAMKKTVGDAFLPAARIGLNLTAHALEFASKNMGTLINVAGVFGSVLALPVLKNMLQLIQRLNILPTILGLTRVSLVASARSMSLFAGKALLLEAALLVARAAYQLFNESSGEFGNIAEESGRGLDLLIEKLNGVENAANKARGGLKAEGFLGEFTKENRFTRNVKNTIPFLGENNPINKVLGYNFAGAIGNRVADQQISNQQRDRTAKVGEFVGQGRQTLAIGESFLTGKNKKDLEEYKQIEEELKKIQVQQQAVRAVRPGSTEELQMLVEEEQRLLTKRGDVIDNVMASRSSIDERIAFAESGLKALKEDLDGGFISLKTYKKGVAEINPVLQDLTKMQERFTAALDSSALSLDQIARSLEDVADRYADAGSNIGTQEAQALTAISGQNITPAQQQSAAQAVSQAGAIARLQANQAAIEQVKQQLATPTLQNSLSALNVSNYSNVGSAEAARISERASENPALKQAADAIQQLRDLESEAAGLQQQIGESSASTRDAIVTANRSVEDYFRSIEEESKKLAFSSEQAANDLNMAQARADIQSAVIGVGKSFIDDFGDSLIAIVEAFNKPLQDAMAANQQRADAQLAYFNTQLQGADLLNSLPGGVSIDGMFGGGGGGGGGELFVGKMGTTGNSTGPHTHFQANDGSRLSLEQINQRYRFNGRPAAAPDVSNDEDDHRNRIHPSRGFDVAIAPGTVVSAINAVSVGPTTWSDSLGWFNEVTFADGFVIRQGHFLEPNAATAGARQSPSGSTTGPVTPYRGRPTSGGSGGTGAPRLGAGYDALNQLGPQLAQSSRFNTSTLNGRAALAIALGIGGSEAFGQNVTRNDFFTMSGGTGGNMKGFAQLNQEYHSGVSATPGRYTDYVGAVLNGDAAQPNGSGGRDFAAQLATAIAQGSVSTGQQLISWMQSVGLGGSNWQGVDDGWSRSPGLADQLVQYLKGQGSTQAAGGGSAPAASADTRYGYERQQQANYVSSVGNFGDRNVKLAPEAAASFREMVAAAAAEGINIAVVSGFRTIQEQEVLWRAQIARRGSPEAAAAFSAPPGYSEHHTGNAIDVYDPSSQSTLLEQSFADTKVSNWLEANAARFGFDQSYDGTTGMTSNEPWHYEFQGLPGAGQGTSGVSADTSMYDAARAQQIGVIQQGNLMAQGILETTLQNIDRQAEAAGILSALQIEVAKQQSDDALTAANENIRSQDRSADRRFIDLSFDAMPDNPDTQLAQSMEGLRRTYEDETTGLTEFNDQLGSTLKKSALYIDAITALAAQGVIPEEQAAAMIEKLRQTNGVATEAFDSSLAKLSEINLLYQDLVDKKLEEARIAEEDRAFSYRQQSEGAGAELGRAQIADFNRRGYGADTPALEADFQRQEITLDFDSKVRDLEAQQRAGERTAEQVATLTALYEELAHINLQNVDVQLQKQNEELARTSRSEVFGSQSTLYESINKRYEIYGGSPSFDSDPFAEQFAVLQQQANFESQLQTMNDLATAGKLVGAALDTVRQNLEMANNVELGNIRAQFDAWTPVIAIAKDSLQGLVSDFILGSKTVGEMFSGMLASAASALAQLAAKKITEGLFGSLINSGNSGSKGSDGGGGGGGFFGSLLSSIFHFSDGTESVPAGNFSDYRKGWGPLSEALVREGPNSVPAALTPGERVLTVAENKEYPRLMAQAKRYEQMKVGAIANFRSGGVVGGGSAASNLAVAPEISIGSPSSNVTLGDVNLTVGGGVDGEKLQESIRANFPALVEAEIIRQQGFRGRLR